MISVVLTIHNQERIIDGVLNGIETNSTIVDELIIVLDGCTDHSESVVTEWFRDSPLKIEYIYADNVFETKANNLGLKEVTNPYAIIIQDDCVIDEWGYDIGLLRPFLKWNNVFAVSGRNSHNIGTRNNGLVYYNTAGWGTELTDPNKFYVRRVVNRGPLMLRMDVVEKLNYFDEIFYPQNGDDHDLCLRAYQIGWICGCKPVRFISEPHWGGTRKGDGKWIADAITKNQKIVMDRHRDLLLKDYPDEDRDL